MAISYRAAGDVRELSVGQTGSNEGNQGGGELHFGVVLLRKLIYRKLRNLKERFENDSPRLDTERETGMIERKKGLGQGQGRRCLL